MVWGNGWTGSGSSIQFPDMAWEMIWFLTLLFVVVHMCEKYRKTLVEITSFLVVCVCLHNIAPWGCIQHPRWSPFVDHNVKMKGFMSIFSLPSPVTTRQSLTGWRSGTSIGSSTTWWPRCWSHPGASSGPARTTTETCSRTSWLRVGVQLLCLRPLKIVIQAGKLAVGFLEFVAICIQIISNQFCDNLVPIWGLKWTKELYKGHCYSFKKLFRNAGIQA